jgi:MarR family transcriptional regulator for hemolysin
MANTLRRMERDGLVQCLPDPNDRRRIRVQLTDRALAIEPDLVSAARTVNGAAAEGLTDEEVATYLRLTARMIENLEADGSR